MGIWIGVGSLLTLSLFIVIYIVGYTIELKKARLHNKYILNRHVTVSHRDFTKLPLDHVEADYRLPRGQWAHFVFECKALYEGEKKRKYVGNTLSGIKLPFVDVSIQNKEFKDTSDFGNRGPVVATLTNRLLRVQTHNSNQSLKRTWNWSSIEQVKFVSDDRTIQVSTNRNAWPMRFEFESHSEALKFANAIWTLVDEYTSIKLEESGEIPDNYIGVNVAMKSRKYRFIYYTDSTNGIMLEEPILQDDLFSRMKMSRVYKISELNKLTKKKLIDLMFEDYVMIDVKDIKKRELISMIMESQYFDSSDVDQESNKDESEVEYEIN